MIGIESFDRPWLGVALALLAAVALWRSARTPAGAIGLPATDEAAAAGASELDWTRALALVLRAGALACIAGVLAGPVALHPVAAEAGRGLDVVLVVDASGSMRALDARVEGEPRSRLDLAREVVARFARERAAEGDRVALVVFGDTAFTQSPLTSDGRLLEAAALRIEPGIAGESTALGDALALGVKRTVQATRARSDDDAGAERDPFAADLALAPDRPAAPIAGRVVVLLTDGRSNAGTLPADVAATLARAHGVRVHAVGLGGEGAVAMAPERGLPARPRFERHDLDMETLERIAAATGGRAFRARTSGELGAVYAEIDALERVARVAPPKPRRAPRPERLLAGAGLLLGLELLLARVLFRTLP